MRTGKRIAEGGAGVLRQSCDGWIELNAGILRQYDGEERLTRRGLGGRHGAERMREDEVLPSD
jgi:hypothetical protein